MLTFGCSMELEVHFKDVKHVVARSEALAKQRLIGRGVNALVRADQPGTVVRVPYVPTGNDKEADKARLLNKQLLFVFDSVKLAAFGEALSRVVPMCRCEKVLVVVCEAEKSRKRKKDPSSLAQYWVEQYFEEGEPLTEKAEELEAQISLPCLLYALVWSLQRLAEAGFLFLDLHRGNVLLKQGIPTLTDYDACLYVSKDPRTRASPSAVSLLLGLVGPRLESECPNESWVVFLFGFLVLELVLGDHAVDIRTASSREAAEWFAELQKRPFKVLNERNKDLVGLVKFCLSSDRRATFAQVLSLPYWKSCKTLTDPMQQKLSAWVSSLPELKSTERKTVERGWKQPLYMWTALREQHEYEVDVIEHAKAALVRLSTQTPRTESLMHAAAELCSKCLHGRARGMHLVSAQDLSVVLTCAQPRLLCDSYVNRVRHYQKALSFSHVDLTRMDDLLLVVLLSDTHPRWSVDELAANTLGLYGQLAHVCIPNSVVPFSRESVERLAADVRLSFNTLSTKAKTAMGAKDMSARSVQLYLSRVVNWHDALKYFFFVHFE